MLRPDRPVHHGPASEAAPHGFERQTPNVNPFAGSPTNNAGDISVNSGKVYIGTVIHFCNPSLSPIPPNPQSLITDYWLLITASHFWSDASIAFPSEPA
jgi:hypothetical protein